MLVKTIPIATFNTDNPSIGIELLDRDYLAEGSKAKVYRKGNVAYKIFTNIPPLEIDKLEELSVLEQSNILKPQDVILDKSKIVGYTSRYVYNTHKLCELFKRSFRDRYKITPEIVLNLVKQMSETVKYIHKKGMVVGDFSEFNFLIRDDFKDVYFIDTDGYKTSKNLPSPVPDYLRDRLHAGHLNELTDWFSFAVLSFMMFTGVHPYGGEYKGNCYSPFVDKLGQRMSRGLSVLNPFSALPSESLPLAVIPKEYRDWYIGIFSEEARVPPPEMTSEIATSGFLPNLKTSSLRFRIAELKSVIGKIQTCCHSTTKQVLLTDRFVYNSGSGVRWTDGGVVGFTSKFHVPVLAAYDPDGDSAVSLYDINRLVYSGNTKPARLPFGCHAMGMMSYKEQIYLLYGNNVWAVNFEENSIHISVKLESVTNVIDHLAQMFDGVVLENLHGSCWASLFPETRKCQKVHLSELDGLHIYDAKFENKVMMVIAYDKTKQYNRYTFRFAKDYQSYDVDTVENVLYKGINFVVLDRGLCIAINREGSLDMFVNLKDSTRKLSVNDSVIDNSIKLCHDGKQVMFTRDNKTFSISMINDFFH